MAREKKVMVRFNEEEYKHVQMLKRNRFKNQTLKISETIRLILMGKKK